MFDDVLPPQAQARGGTEAKAKGRVRMGSCFSFELSVDLEHTVEVVTQPGVTGVLPRHHAVERKLRFISPMPCILEGLNLGFRLLPGRALEKHVVPRLAVERSVEVNKVYAFIVNASPQNREVVAVIDGVQFASPEKCASPRAGWSAPGSGRRI